MIKSLLAIIADIFWLIVRGKKIQDDPVNKIENERQQFQKAAISGDETTVNIVLNSELQRLRDKESVNGDSK